MQRTVTRRSSCRSILACTALVVGFLPSPAHADQAPLWSDSELTRFADAIVMGTVVDVHAEWDSGIDAAYTRVTLDVSAVLKGPLPLGRVMLKQLGGETAGVRLVVPGQAVFAVGERVLVFLEQRPRDGTFYTVGFWQGKWQLVTDGTRGGFLAVRVRPDAGRRGIFGPARDVRRLEDLTRTATARMSGSSDDAFPMVAQAAGSRNASSLVRERLPMARAGAAETAAEVRLRFGVAATNTSNLWNRAIAMAARQWNQAQAGRHIVEDGSSSPRCAISLDASGAATVDVAGPCEELSRSGSVVAFSGAYVEAKTAAADHDGAVLHRFLVANEPVLQVLTPACVELAATHEVGHALGLSDAGERGDALSSVLANTCGTARRLFRSLVPRGVSAADLTQLRDAHPAAGVVSAVPGAPRNLWASVDGGAAAVVTWAPPASGGTAIEYVIEAGSMSGASDLANVITGDASTSLTANDPLPAGRYFIRVRGVNSAGLGPPSNEFLMTVGTADSAVPGAPGGLNSAVVGSTVILNWAASSTGGQPNTYVIEAGSSSGGSNLAAFATNSVATTFTATDVPNGTYYVRVRAGNGAGTGAASNEIVVVVGAVTPTPPTTITLSGRITRNDTTCRDPIFGDQACWIAPFTVNTSGTVTVTLTWPESVDLDLSLWRDGTVLDRSLGETQSETVSALAAPGEYEAHVTYYSGTVPANFVLRISTPAPPTPPPPAPAPVPTPEASGVIGPGGGSVAVTSATSPIAGARIDIPAGALSQSTTITISLPATEPIPASRLSPLSRSADFGPSGLSFNVPVIITMPSSVQASADMSTIIYEQDAVYAIPLNNYADPHSETIGQSIDSTGRFISYSTTHLSTRRVLTNREVNAFVRTARAAHAVQGPGTSVDLTIPFSPAAETGGVRCTCLPRSVIAQIVIHSTHSAPGTTFVNEVTYAAIRATDFAHYYIDRDGTVIQVAPDLVTTNHTEGRNSNAIGIELFAPMHDRSGGEVYSDYTSAQIAAAVKLTKALMDNYRIGTNGVGRHKDFPTGNTAHDREHSDPFGWSDANWDAFKAQLTTPSCTAAPNAPIGLSGAVTGMAITLTWSAPSGGQAATSYLVEIGTSPGASNILSAGAGLTTSYATSSLASGTYYARVRATNGCGTSTPSNEITVIVGGATTTVYSGPFSGSFTESQSQAPQCVFRFSYSGQQVLTLTVRADQTVTGSVRITGTQVTPSSTNCRGGTFPVDQTDAVSGTVSSMRWAHNNWTIQASLSGTTVTGTMTISGSRGTSTFSGSIPFSLSRQ